MQVNAGLHGGISAAFICTLILFEQIYPRWCHNNSDVCGIEWLRRPHMFS